MARTFIDPLKTALLVADFCETIHDLEAQLVTVTAERETLRELLSTSQEQLHLATVCLRRQPFAREMASLVDDVQAALIDDEVAS